LQRAHTPSEARQANNTFQQEANVATERATVSGYDDTVEESEKKSGRGCIFWVVVLLILAGGGAATAGLMGTIILREETPLPGEEFMSDLALRTLAIPGEFQDLRIPSKNNTADAIAQGKQLFEVECAMCHGIGGRGDSALGQTQYPPAADLTKNRTRQKTDGQLFWLIAHGINLTGMPAWGTNYGGANTDDEIWNMVAYIRTLK
jgi:mono/diheme cytochrome c family protein